MSSVGDLGINILASIVVGVAVGLFGRWRRRRKEARIRDFLGIEGDNECVISVPHHASSPLSNSVNRGDVAAMIEIAALAKEHGATVDLRVEDQDAAFESRLGRRPEFCVGGPDGNSRTGEHLRTFVPGFQMERFAEAGRRLRINIGDRHYDSEPGSSEYVAVIKIVELAKPVFVICGQTALANRAAARYLSEHAVRLIKDYGVRAQFCFVLQVVNSRSYGDGVVRFVEDFNELAFTLNSTETIEPREKSA